MPASNPPSDLRASVQRSGGALGTLAVRARQLAGWLWRREAALRGVEMLGPVDFQGRAVISVHRGSRMVFAGEHVFASALRCNPLGNFQPCVLRTLTANALLRLDRGVSMSGTVLCAARSIEVGEGTIFGSGAMVLDNDFHQPEGEFGWSRDGASTARPVIIGRGCFIGARAIVLKGVTLGDRVVVGAGAVVTKDAPAGTLVVGNPGRNVSR